MMQAFLTGWELSDRQSQDEYLQSSIQVIEMLQVEPEAFMRRRRRQRPDGGEKWIIWTTGCVPTAGGCTGVRKKISSWSVVPRRSRRKGKKLAQLEELGDGKHYLVIFPQAGEHFSAENFTAIQSGQLRS